MKKYSPYLALLVFITILTLSACTRAQSTQPPAEAIGPSPTAEVLTQLPDAIASQTAAPTLDEVIPTEAPPTATEPPSEPAEEPTAAPPTATPIQEIP